MKKIIVVILILCICLAGCSSSPTAIENGNSVISQSSNLTNSLDSSNIMPNSSQSSQSSIPTVTEGPEPEYFSFTAETIEDFVLWSKTKGTAKVGLNGDADNPLNQTYLNWVKTQNSLLIPKIKEPINIRYVEPFEKRNGYLMNINLKELKNSHNAMLLHMYSLSDDLQNHDIDYITNNWLHVEIFPTKKSAIIHNGNCVFGEYRYINSIESNQKNSSAWFIKDKYLIYMSAYISGEDVSDDWQEEYFDYFDFETVSLK